MKKETSHWPKEFRGQTLPGNVVLEHDGETEPEEGEIIGHTEPYIHANIEGLWQVDQESDLLVWMMGMVVIMSQEMHRRKYKKS